MNIIYFSLRILIIFYSLGVIQQIIFSSIVFAQKRNLNELSSYISDIKIEGTSDLESSQIIFLIESQIGDILDRRKIRKDIHSIYKMNLYDDVQAIVIKQNKNTNRCKRPRSPRCVAALLQTILGRFARNSPW